MLINCDCPECKRQINLIERDEKTEIIYMLKFLLNNKDISESEYRKAIDRVNDLYKIKL